MSSEIVYNAIEDTIFETHKFCSIRKIMERTGKSRNVCEKALVDLLSRDRIYVVYEGAGVPNIYVPKYMLNEILLTQRKPDWLRNYSFEKRAGITSKIRELKKRLFQYEMFERLLYATGEPLEEAVCFSLKWLGIREISCHIEGDKDVQDIDFEINSVKYLVEVKGKTGAADKDDIEELNGWRKQEVLKEEIEPEKIQGILIINHFRRVDPKCRGDTLTNHAKKWLKMYRLKALSTYSVFELVQDVKRDDLKREEAIRRIIQGEKK